MRRVSGKTLVRTYRFGTSGTRTKETPLFEVPEITKAENGSLVVTGWVDVPPAPAKGNLLSEEIVEH